jgi:hypothetical protein
LRHCQIRCRFCHAAPAHDAGQDVKIAQRDAAADPTFPICCAGHRNYRYGYGVFAIPNRNGFLDIAARPFGKAAHQEGINTVQTCRRQTTRRHTPFRGRVLHSPSALPVFGQAPAGGGRAGDDR